MAKITQEEADAIKFERVNLIAGHKPEAYHCDCKYCTQVIGELRREDGSYYSRLDRRKYYSLTERSKDRHICPTPLHTARWAIQTYTKPGDWVLDPTIGAGSTAVESLTHGRNVSGMELQFSKVLTDNIAKHIRPGLRAEIAEGDARNIGPFLDEIDQQFDLVVNGPPYSGDANAGLNRASFTYDSSLPNIAFLKEGAEYWRTMSTVYGACIDHLKPGGHFVITIKDMVRRKQPFLLHKLFNELMENELGMEFVGTAFLKHYPTTLFLNTYFKSFGVHPPYYQTIAVFKKPE